MATLTVDMRDVYPAAHWAVRGEAPAFDTPDSDVYLEGRNIVLLSKVGVYMAARDLTRVRLGTLAANPFPTATPIFFDAMQHALSTRPRPTHRHRDAVRGDAQVGCDSRSARRWACRLELTLSCMQPERGVHCGRCSKCRERRDAFNEAGVEDPADYASPPLR